MATILVVPHLHDRFKSSHYLLKAFFPHWTRLGHQVLVRCDLDHLPDADVAVLHVDRALISDRYAAAVARYPVIVNAGARDLTKRAVSANLVTHGDTWDGKVIVKVDHHAGLTPEASHAIYDDKWQVPESTWLDPAQVVERFLPEPDPDGYAVRMWTFLGDRERCTRYVGREAVVRATDFVSRVPCEVPDVIRAERQRLGVDYGRFDFVIHDGRPVLLDASATPTLPANVSSLVASSNADLSLGMSAFLEGARVSASTTETPGAGSSSPGPHLP